MSTPAQHATQFILPHHEMVAVLLKHLNIHEGYWSLSVNFAFAAMNIGAATDGSDLSPAGLVRLEGIGIQRMPNLDPANPLVVDAAVVNPRA